MSMPFARPRGKRSPSLTASDWVVECTSANTLDYLLQPKESHGPLNGMFVEDEKPKKTGKDEEAKIKAIQHRLSQRGTTNFKESDISYAVATPYANGDQNKAYELLALVADSEEGIVLPYKVDIKLLGAVNRESVTCWLDSLLFALFARLGSFEAMLYQKFDDEPRKRLVTLLRLWVNVLRAGKLITTDITKQIQMQLANCGWKEAAELYQHDASEAFTFITETLALPLLTLKMDIFHTGREDQKDDHKFIHERLLELAIPDETQDCQSVTLEDCLEMYFNNKIEVKRYMDALERKNTLTSIRSKSSVDSRKGYMSHIEVAEINESAPPTPLTPVAQFPSSPSRPTMQRHRAPSIIQDHYIDEKRGLLDGEGDGRQARTRKEVMMPAWQFFRLIPWYTNKQPTTDAQVAAHFSSTRPVLGICLKRYGLLQNGTTYKKRTHVDIPLEIALPHFISDDDMSEDAPVFGNFKLSLQSFVCHEGRSVDVGHYISFARTPDPSQQGQDTWMRFDDLAKERVIEVSVEDRLKRESPYLLFYQVVPIGDTPTPPSREDSGFEDAPPSYAESNASLPSKNQMSSTEDSSGYVRSSEEGGLQRQSTNTSISESEKRGRSSISLDRPTNRFSSRAQSPMVTSNAPSIEVAPSDMATNPGPSKIDPASLNGGALSTRRDSNISKSSNKSRPTSSSGEKRFSVSLTRLSKRMSGDRLSQMPELEMKAAPKPAPAPAPAILETEDADEEEDGTKSKKQSKERAKFGLKDHHHLLSRTKKPDRECSVM